jgi:dTDP-4-dehydrorhamnose reductase
MKTVVLGSAGQLGRDLVALLPGHVVALTRADADLTDAIRLRACLEAHRPDRVVNCAAYNLVDRAESEPRAAFDANSWAVYSLAGMCRDLDATLIHFSTDYVFGLDATRQVPWTETEAPGPVSAYGLSKLSGEYWTRMLCPKHFVIRTCGLYGLWGQGGKGGNFVETMLRLAGQGKPLRVVNDQRCSPSFTRDIAIAAIALIETGKFGLYHLTNAGACSWFEFAAEIFRQAGVDVHLTPISSEEYKAPAKRPAYSVLDNAAAIAAGAPALRPWQEALGDYLSTRKTEREAR